jgi:hypothetical protein
VQGPLGGERAAIFKTVRDVQIERVECIVNPMSDEGDEVQIELRKVSDAGGPEPPGDLITMSSITCGEDGASVGEDLLNKAIGTGHWVYFNVLTVTDKEPAQAMEPAEGIHLTVTVVYSIRQATPTE